MLFSLSAFQGVISFLKLYPTKLSTFPTQFSDYRTIRGLPIIIDYWSFNCSSCLRSFPETEILQKKYEGKVKFILVNMESRQATIKLFDKFKTIKTKVRMSSLPMVTGDTIFRKLVPVRGLPMLLWINTDGKLAYITDGINEKQLVQFINSNQAEVIEKTPQADFINKAPLIEQANKEYLKDITYYSYIAHNLTGSNIGSFYKQKRNNGKLIRISTNQASICELIANAYGENLVKYAFYPDVNVILEVNDRFKYMRPKKEDSLSVSRRKYWNDNYWFRYDCAVPAEQEDRIYEFMRNDVCRYFNLNVSIEKRRMKCLALVRTIDSMRLYRFNNFDSTFYKHQLLSKNERIDTVYNLNITIKNVIDILRPNYRFFGVKMPIVDETNYEGTFNFNILYTDDGVTTRQYWNEQLALYGLALVEKECVTDVLIIREK